jgi:hypothetical protein
MSSHPYKLTETAGRRPQTVQRRTFSLLAALLLLLSSLAVLIVPSNVSADYVLNSTWSSGNSDGWTLAGSNGWAEYPTGGMKIFDTSNSGQYYAWHAVTLPTGAYTIIIDVQNDGGTNTDYALVRFDGLGPALTTHYDTTGYISYLNAAGTITSTGKSSPLSTMAHLKLDVSSDHASYTFSVNGVVAGVYPCYPTSGTVTKVFIGGYPDVNYRGACTFSTFQIYPAAAWRPAYTTNAPSEVIAGAHYQYTPGLNESATLTAPVIPTWLTLAGGTLSGTAPASGSYSVSLSAQSSLGGMVAYQNWTISVYSWASTWLTTPSAFGQVGTTYNYHPILNESATITGITVPSWLTWNGSTLAGTPGAGDIRAWSVSLRASGGAGTLISSQDWTITVNDIDRWQPLVTTNPPDTVQAAMPYSYRSMWNESVTLTFSGPAWLTLDGDTLTGTAPNIPGAAHCSLRGQSVAGTKSYWQNWTIAITAEAPVITTEPPAGIHKAGQPYEYPAFGNGYGGGPEPGIAVDFTTTAPWIDYNETTGTFEGVPPTTGRYDVNATFTNTTTGLKSYKNWTIETQAPLPEIIEGGHDQAGSGTSEPVDTIELGAPYSYVEGTDAHPAAILLITNAGWLYYNATNLTVWGTPNALGTYYAHVQIVNTSSGLSAWDNYTIIVTAQPPTITTTAAFDVDVGNAWTYSFRYAPSSALMEYHCDIGSVVEYNATTRTFTWSPTTPGQAHISIRVWSEITGLETWQNITVTAHTWPPEFRNSPKTTVTVRTFYEYRPVMDKSGVTWELSGDAYWLTLAWNGYLSGTPTQIGEFHVNLTATNARGWSSSMVYTITVKAAATTGNGGTNNGTTGPGTNDGNGDGDDNPLGGAWLDDNIYYSSSYSGPTIAIIFVLALLIIFFLVKRRKKE